MKKLSVLCILSALAVCQVACHRSNPDNGPIRLNQVGFAPDQEKTATIVLTNDQSPITNVFILNENGDTVPLAISPSPIAFNPVSGKPCQIVDFSSLTTPGTYTLCVNQQSKIINLKFEIINLQS